MKLFTIVLTLLSATAFADGFGWQGRCVSLAHSMPSTVVISPWDDDAHLVVTGGPNGQQILADQIVSVSTFDSAAPVVTFHDEKSVQVLEIDQAGLTGRLTLGSRSEVLVCSSFGMVQDN